MLTSAIGTGPMPPKVASASTVSPARPSPPRQTTVSMNDLAASLETDGTGRYSSSTAGRSIE